MSANRTWIVISLLLAVGLADGVSAVVPPRDEAPRNRHQDRRGRLVDIGEGTRLYLDCVGEGSPTVIIDGGAGAWSVHYRRIQDEVADSARVCTYDRAGLGLSDVSAAPRTSSTMADELHRLLHAAGEAGPFLLVGHSLGGYNVRIYQRRYGSEVAGLVLLESAHESQWDRLPGAWEAVEARLPGMRAYAEALRAGEVDLDEMPPWPASLSPAARDDYEAAIRTPKVHDTVADELESARLSATQVPKGKLGRLPLVVVSSLKSFEAFRGTGVPIEESNEVWLELQAELLTLTDSAEHLVTDIGDHDIARTDPALAVMAIRRALELVRADDEQARARTRAERGIERGTVRAISGDVLAEHDVPPGNERPVLTLQLDDSRSAVRRARVFRALVQERVTSKVPGVDPVVMAVGFQDGAVNVGWL